MSKFVSCKISFGELIEKEAKLINSIRKKYMKGTMFDQYGELKKCYVNIFNDKENKYKENRRL